MSTMDPTDYENASDTNMDGGQVSASSGKTAKRACRCWFPFSRADLVFLFLQRHSDGKEERKSKHYVLTVLQR